LLTLEHNSYRFQSLNSTVILKHTGSYLLLNDTFCP